MAAAALQVSTWQVGRNAAGIVIPVAAVAAIGGQNLQLLVSTQASLEGLNFYLLPVEPSSD